MLFKRSYTICGWKTNIAPTSIIKIYNYVILIYVVVLNYTISLDSFFRTQSLYINILSPLICNAHMVNAMKWNGHFLWNENGIAICCSPKINALNDRWNPWSNAVSSDYNKTLLLMLLCFKSSNNDGLSYDLMVYYNLFNRYTHGNS